MTNTTPTPRPATIRAIDVQTGEVVDIAGEAVLVVEVRHVRRPVHAYTEVALKVETLDGRTLTRWFDGNRLLNLTDLDA